MIEPTGEQQASSLQHRGAEAREAAAGEQKASSLQHRGAEAREASAGERGESSHAVDRRAEDYGAALARFDGGAQGSFFQHWGSYPTVQCELQVFGEEGMVHVRSWDSVELLAHGSRSTRHFYSPGMGLPERTLVGMVAELEEMLSSVREARAPAVGGAEGRAALAAVLAVYESSASGQWVTVA